MIIQNGPRVFNTRTYLNSLSQNIMRVMESSWPLVTLLWNEPLYGLTYLVMEYVRIVVNMSS